MISVVIPLFNEEKLIDELLERTLRTMLNIGEPYEIICVDDGSTDNTQLLLRAFQKKHKGIKIIVLSRNFGHQAAFTAGLHHAKGDCVAMLDGDLQDPPEIIHDFYKQLKDQPYDVVTGRRTVRNQPKRKILPVKIFHIIFRQVAEMKEMEDAGNFCLMSRQVVNALLLMNERQRYLPGLRVFAGFRNCYFDYERNDRHAGKAKMTNLKLLKLATDALFAFSDWPIKLCFFLGLFGVLTSLLAFAHTMVSKIFHWAPPGWSSMYLSIYFFGAVQLLFLGIIGEYVYRIYKEIQNRPNYFVRETIE